MPFDLDSLLGSLDAAAASLLAQARTATVAVEAAWAGATDTERAAVAVGAVVALVAFVAWVAVRRRNPAATELRAQTRGARMLGWAALALFLGAFVGWGGLAPLTSAAIASGVVSPEGERKTVQHLEGGIVREIHVAEGDRVAAGQPLVTLENVQAQAAWLEARERFLHLLATEARLQAEEAGFAEIAFPAALTEPETQIEAAEAARAIASQQALFDSRKESLLGNQRILQQRIAQLEEEISGLREVIAAEERQSALIGQELKGVRELYEKGLERLPRVLALQRQQAQIEASRAANRADIARRQQQIGETETRLLTLKAQYRETIGQELADTRAQLASVRSRLPSTADALARTQVTAPIDGIVMNVQVTTISGVVRSGEPILDVVPEAARLVIDARIRPTDIDTVEPGMPAQVVLSAFSQRNLPKVEGRLLTVSADRFTDERTGEAWFEAKVEVDPASLPEGVRLTAGMPAEVMIVTGERTLLAYLVEPFTDSFARSFREQ